MVVSGLERNTPSNEVVAYVLDVTLAAAKCEAQDRFCTRKLTSYGIIRFRTMKDKSKFKRWLAGLAEPLKYQGRKLHIGDNETKEERTKGRALSKVYRALMEKQPDRKDVTRGQRTQRSHCGQEAGGEVGGWQAQVEGRGVGTARTHPGFDRGEARRRVGFRVTTLG